MFAMRGMAGYVLCVFCNCLSGEKLRRLLVAIGKGGCKDRAIDAKMSVPFSLYVRELNIAIKTGDAILEARSACNGPNLELL
jgi:hypothetical protein